MLKFSFENSFEKINGSVATMFCTKQNLIKMVRF